jgi:hypothetical protein
MQEGVLEDYFSCLHTPSDAGNLEGRAFVECGEGRKGRAKIYPEIGERHHHMILSGLRTLEGVCSVLLELNIEDMVACSLAKN